MSSPQMLLSTRYIFFLLSFAAFCVWNKAVQVIHIFNPLYLRTTAVDHGIPVEPFSPPPIGSDIYFQSLCEDSKVLSLSRTCSDDNKAEENIEPLECQTLNEQTKGKKLVNFFSFAEGETYTNLLPFYAFHALHSNPDAVVEMVVPDRMEFVQTHNHSLSWLLKTYGKTSVCVRNILPETMRRTKCTNTWRFLETPTVQAVYTYIGDIDILITEPVVTTDRLEQMEHWHLPYSDVIRHDSERLTGLILLRTSDYFTKDWRDYVHSRVRNGTTIPFGDEAFLYQLNEAVHGLPGHWNESDPWSTYRPEHGLHLSHNRGPGKRLCLPNFDRQRWCPFLRAPHQNEFLCTSPFALDFVQTVGNKVKDQMNHKMRSAKIVLSTQQPQYAHSICGPF